MKARGRVGVLIHASLTSVLYDCDNQLHAPAALFLEKNPPDN